MKSGSGNLIKRAALWIAPFVLMLPSAAHAQWAQRYGYYDDDHGMRHHQRDEKRDLKRHQREEQWQYGDSWELRQHQKEERHKLKHHQKHERGYDSYNGSYGRDGYSRRGWYDGRRY